MPRAPNHVIMGPVHAPNRSFLVGAYSHTHKYLEKIIDASNLKRHAHHNDPIRRRDFETQRQRELALAELSVHLGESVLSKLRLDSGYTTESYTKARAAGAQEYKCQHAHEEDAKLHLQSETYTFINTLFNKRHTKKFNLRLVEGHLINACLRCVHSEVDHGNS